MIYILSLSMSNYNSVAKAVDRVGYTSKVINVDEIVRIKSRSLLIIPGVGHMQSLLNELESTMSVGALRDVILCKDLSIIGICLGFQFMCQSSEEASEAELLSIFDYKVSSIHRPSRPNVGWFNTFFNPSSAESNQLSLSIEFNGAYYYTHSYAAIRHDSHCKRSQAQGNQSFYYQSSPNTATIAGLYGPKAIGFQFHPEKSGSNGLSILNHAIKFLI